MRKKACAGIRQVVGQVGLVQAWSELGDQLRADGAAGGRHVGEQQTVLRIVGEQRLDQRFGGAGFANGDDVQPEQRADRACRIASVALGQMMQVFRLPTGSPEQAEPYERLGEVEAQGVDEAAHALSPW